MGMLGEVEGRGLELMALHEGVPPAMVLVRFLEENDSARGHFMPGEVAMVSTRRATVWREGGIVELVDEE